jgi:hypothetical protein
MLPDSTHRSPSDYAFAEIYSRMASSCIKWLPTAVLHCVGSTGAHLMLKCLLHCCYCCYCTAMLPGAFSVLCMRVLQIAAACV